jgi:hypothetical protein
VPLCWRWGSRTGTPSSSIPRGHGSPGKLTVTCHLSDLYPAVARKGHNESIDHESAVTLTVVPRLVERPLRGSGGEHLQALHHVAFCDGLGVFATCGQDGNIFFFVSPHAHLNERCSWLHQDIVLHL